MNFLSFSLCAVRASRSVKWGVRASVLFMVLMMGACGGGGGGGGAVTGGGGSASFSPTATSYTLSVTANGTGSGSVTANPGGISCATTGSGNTGTCSGSYAGGTLVTLTANPVNGYGFNWGGACAGTSTCTVLMSAARSVTATFTPITLTVGLVGTGTGSVALAGGTFSCGSSGACTSTNCNSGTCTSQIPSGTSVTLMASPSAGFSFTGWSGACSGLGSCVLSGVATSQSVTASFSALSSCQQTGASTTLATLVGNSTGTGFTTDNTLLSPCAIETTYHTVNGICYGNYVVQPNTYANPPANTTLSMWSNSASCWGIVQNEPTNSEASGNPVYWNGPLASRGFSQGPNTLLTSSGGLQVSAINAQYNATTPCPSPGSGGSAQSVCAKWTMSVPGTTPGSAINTSTNFYTTWDALMDIYFHAEAVPATFERTTFDLQIYQMVMDFQISGVPNWANFVFGKGRYTTKTINGTQYYVNVNMGDPGSEGSGWVGRGGTYNSVSLVPVSSTAITLTAGAGGSYLWGVPSAVHDVGGIIKWLSETTTINGTTGIHDDAGNLLYDNVRGASVTSPLLNPLHYLTGLDPGFEVLQTTQTSTYPNNATFTTTNLWIALPGEVVGN